MEKRTIIHLNPDALRIFCRVVSRGWSIFKLALFPLRCLVCGQLYFQLSVRTASIDKDLPLNVSDQVIPAASLFGRLMRSHVCPACSEQFVPVASPHCTCCGLMFNSREGSDHICGECLSATRYYGMARAVGVYDRALMTVIHCYKYGRKVNLAEPLSILLLNTYRRFWRGRPMDIVIPVPLFRHRLRNRGFNQVYLTIRHWKDPRWQQVLEMPLRIDNVVLQRKRPTPPQTGLGRRERMRNVKGAFALGTAEAIRNKKILLVDDVYTTGATVNECARVLLTGGAESVDVLTVARAM
jgi:ComF family protein